MKIWNTFYRNLLVSYSPTLRFREIHGDAKTEELLDKCITNLKKALDQENQDYDTIEVQAMNESFIVMNRGQVVIAGEPAV